ncbi:hypothetical protein ACFFX0_14070 [Citricoccus parietis]|uniref:Uncharacterized protein n=1 Tax=Citricoccus parietis TaxID=592307 RepID=A0ABV5G005_9MICC
MAPTGHRPAGCSQSARAPRAGVRGPSPGRGATPRPSGTRTPWPAASWPPWRRHRNGHRSQRPSRCRTFARMR